MWIRFRDKNFILKKRWHYFEGGNKTTCGLDTTKGFGNFRGKFNKHSFNNTYHIKCRNCLKLLYKDDDG